MGEKIDQPRQTNHFVPRVKSILYDNKLNVLPTLSYMAYEAGDDCNYSYVKLTCSASQRWYHAYADSPGS